MSGLCFPRKYEFICNAPFSVAFELRSELLMERIGFHAVAAEADFVNQSDMFVVAVQEAPGLEGSACSR
jgi:hypothetical protein